MAKLYYSYNENEGALWKKRAQAILLVTVPCAIMLYGAWKLLLSVVLFGLVCLAAGVWAARKTQASRRILRSGVEGERETARALRSLPAGVSVFVNPQFTESGQPVEIDALCVGAFGVCIVETKHVAGTVRGSVDAAQWTQTRSGKGGVPLEKQMKNPIRQAARQRDLLRSQLARYGFRVPVHTLVFFNHDFVTVEVRDRRIVTDAQTLRKKVEALPQRLSKTEVLELRRFIKSTRQ